MAKEKLQEQNSEDSKVNPEKLKAVEYAISQIEKEFGKGSIMRFSEDSVIKNRSDFNRMSFLRYGDWGWRFAKR